MDTATKIKQTLSSRFIYSDRMAEILALAITGQKNCLIFGPAGHGKSQMVECALNSINADSFTQFFGEGMDEARLFGGLNFEKFNKEHVLEYQTERSFLAHDIAVFEEVFDAPASVLLALKDTLTSGILRNGSQQVPSRCKTVIALTNRSPKDISELGPSAHALVERFTLQMNLEWQQYNADVYCSMFDRVVGARNPLHRTLATIIASDEAGFVSPRTAMHALQVIKTASAVRGSHKVEQVDLVALRFVPGLEKLSKQLEDNLVATQLELETQEKLKECADHMRRHGDCDDADTPIKALKIAKEMTLIATKLSSMRVTDKQASARQALLDKVNSLITEAQNKALNLTRI